MSNIYVNEPVRKKTTDRKQYSEYLLIAFLTYMSLYIILNSALELFYDDNPIYKVGNFVGLFLAICTLIPLARKVPTDFLIAPLKVNKKRIKYALKDGFLLFLIFGNLMIALKLALLFFEPDLLKRAHPFFYMDRLMPGNITTNTMLYPLTAFWQQYCINVMGYDGMRTLLVGNHRKNKSVSVVALFFGAMHYIYGFPMIVFTALFVIFMNYIYRRTRNLWVCWIVHILLGQLLFTLQLQKIGFGL